MSELATTPRVAIIGAGYFGQFHFDAWQRMAGVTLAGFCETDAGRAAQTCETFGIPAFADAIEMVGTLKPDLIDITAPPPAHLGLIEALAPLVGHIICQKPFCGGVDGARKAIAVAERHNTRLAIHENVRFQPWYREAKKLMEAGAIGTPYQVSFRMRTGDGQGPDAYLDRQPYFQTMPRLLVHETAIHWIDTFRYLMGEISSTHAHLSRLNPVIAGEDAALITFQFENGTRGLYDGNRLSDHIATNRRLTMGEMALEGSGGTLRLDGEGRLWLRAFGVNDEVEHRFDWRDHYFGGDCVYLCNRAILTDWQRGKEAETEAHLYLRNQEIVEEIYAAAPPIP